MAMEVLELKLDLMNLNFWLEKLPKEFGSKY